MNPNRKHLDRWARNAGYSDFDTYVRSGGSILDVRRDIAGRIAALQAAIAALDSHPADVLITPKPVAESQPHAPILEHDTADNDEPPDPHNAHPQGDDPA